MMRTAQRLKFCFVPSERNNGKIKKRETKDQEKRGEKKEEKIIRYEEERNRKVVVSVVVDDEKGGKPRIENREREWLTKQSNA